jgi:hypothetical protein
VRQRIQVILVLLTWFLATGSQWDLAQVFAWGRMFAGYSRQMTVGAAVQKTFSGEMCPICRAVQKAKQEQESKNTKTPEAKNPGKLLDMVPLRTSAVVISPVRQTIGLLAPDQEWTGRARATPPTPPPRVAA